MSGEIVVGTRGSRLALWQTQWVLDRLRERWPGLTCRVRTIKTKGDKLLDVALAKIGDKGLFTKELEQALLAGEIDLAVHSMKDLPTGLPDGLTLAAVCPREFPGDALVSRDGRTLEALPPGARVGTSSLRRTAQLLHHRPDLEMVPVRGNVPTRLTKLQTENLDALVLAWAGLRRLGLENRVTERLPFEVCLPAVGQGAIGVEIRAGDERVRAMVAPLNDPATEAAVRAERSFLKRLGGGCQVPVAALGRVEGDVLALEGLVATPDGRRLLRASLSGSCGDPEGLGIRLAEELLARGGEEILQEVRERQP